MKDTKDEQQTDLLGFTSTLKGNSHNDYGFSDSQQKAFDLMKSKQNLYICGPAGTGKSYLINCFADYCRKNQIPLLLCAPTGMAAREINGETCHATFLLDIGVQIDKGKLTGHPIKTLTEAEVILIDEVSMLRIDAFEKIIKKIEHANSCRKKDVEKLMNGSDEERRKIKDSEWKLNPIQVILVGDFFQLPPVIDKKDRGTLEGDKMYNCGIGNGYPFQSDYWRSYGCGFETFRLTDNVRQKDDKDFADALNQLRKGKISGSEYILEHSAEHPIKDGIWLYGRKKDVNRENLAHLSKLPGEARTYKMTMKNQDDIGDSELSAERTLVLKTGARVMSLINDPHGERYVNGSLGTVKRLTDDLVTVQFDNGARINVERFEWGVFGYKVVDDKLTQYLKGSYKQFPLKLAYAMTIHKSQGQTFDKANISTRTFAAGQLYVALSRVRNVKDMYVEGSIDEKNLTIDDEVLRFDRHPNQYRFFKHSGGARKGAGRKPAKEGRGPTKPVRIPVRYQKYVNQCMKELDEFSEADLKGMKAVIIPAKYDKKVKKFIAELDEKSEK